MSKPVDLVAEQMAEVEQRREDAWAALKKMHDQANGVDVFNLIASAGWCAPSSATYASAVPFSFPEAESP
jgi:hypothetical protein